MIKPGFECSLPESLFVLFPRHCTRWSDCMRSLPSLQRLHTRPGSSLRTGRWFRMLWRDWRTQPTPATLMPAGISSSRSAQCDLMLCSFSFSSVIRCCAHSAQWSDVVLIHLSVQMLCSLFPRCVHSFIWVTVWVWTLLAWTERFSHCACYSFSGKWPLLPLFIATSVHQAVVMTFFVFVCFVFLCFVSKWFSILYSVSFIIIVQE